MQLDRYKIHDIEMVIDRLKATDAARQRITTSVQTAMKHGKGALLLLNETTGITRFLSQLLMDPATGNAYNEPEPNTFSFNSPYGACPRCNGLGVV